MARTRLLRQIEQSAEPAVGEALALQGPQPLRGEIAESLRRDLLLLRDELLDLRQEPRIDVRELRDALEGPAGAEGVGDIQQPVGSRRAQLVGEPRLAVLIERQLHDGREAVETGLEPAQRLLQRLLEGAADGHHLAHRLHLGRQAVVGGRKLLEGEARDLGDHVVDRGLEGRRRGAAGDVVLQLIERVADGELGGDLGDREARRLGSERRGARHARIHLDDEQAPVLRTDSELHVRAARIDADLAQHRDRGVAHALIFLVRQSQRRRHGDGVARMHAHRVQVLDRADDDAVVLVVAHHLHLEFFPADHRLLEQHLGGRRGVEPARHDVLELLAVVGDAAAAAAERERRADHDRVADFRRDGQCLIEAARDLRVRRLEPDLAHGVAEQLAVLGHVDRGPRGGDQLHAVLLQHALAHQVERGVERGLSAHGRQQRIRALLLDDARHRAPVDRLDVDRIRHLRDRS